MNYGESGLSASDVALISGNGRNNSGDGFGDGNGWWIIIFLIFALGGWGNGWGNNGNNGGSMGAADNYVLASDFATLQRQMDSGFGRIGDRIEAVNNGICNGFYETLSNFNNTNMNVANGFSNLNNALCNQSFQIERGITGLGSQLANCCCDIRQEIASTSCATQRGLDAINYNMAMNTNSLQNSMCNNTRDIIDSQNSGTRAILDALTANRIEDKNAQIQAQQNEINALRLAASQAKQNSYLVNELRPCPIPAYITCNPYQSYNNNNCGCNCGNY